MQTFLLQSTASIGAIAASSVGSALQYIPYALGIGVAAGIGIVIYRKYTIQKQQKEYSEFERWKAGKLTNGQGEIIDRDAPGYQISGRLPSIISKMNPAGQQQNVGMGQSGEQNYEPQRYDTIKVSDWARATIAILAKNHKKSEKDMLDALCLFYIQNSGSKGGKGGQQPPQQQAGSKSALFSTLDRMSQDFQSGKGIWGGGGI